ncbi:MAG TPA: adenylyltransferase/cytidyltransferase family protein [Aestuariivirga sp.]|nr:adenylyltransferase/cytidyltransferase family protein [Aestuariivirga sp.]
MITGYTTGVFDMFHVGHLRILQRAREQCDRLIVGVSTDDLVESYKKKRPIIPQADRMEIVRAIRYVDAVIPQTHRDKFRAWEELRFNVMFVGDDWKGDPLFTSLEGKFSAVGVKIVFFPYTKHVSSSRLSDVLHAIERDGQGI